MYNELYGTLDIDNLPDRLQVLHAHPNRFCLWEEAEGLGFQIDKHGTHTETLQI